MDDEISAGVRILCERMENNPEEFEETEYNPSTMYRKLGKFYYDGREIESLAKGEAAGKENFWYLNEAEKAMLVKAYVDMRRRWATQKVVEKLLAEPEPEPEPVRYKGNGPLTKTQIINESLSLLSKSFDEAYPENHETDSLLYKATGRYEIPNPWDKK